MPHHRRRIRLIRPRLQLKLLGAFFGVAVLALALQYLVFQRALTELALRLPNDGAVLTTQANARLGAALLIAVLVLAPAMFAIGLMLTHRIVGPIYRFEQFLHSVDQGRMREECRIRKGDEFQELCELINRVTREARARAPQAPAAGERDAA
jgi:signal peptidase II